jgi:hypothetical protein
MSKSKITVAVVGLALAACWWVAAGPYTINVGTNANDGTGDTMRSAFSKVNSNFVEVYNLVTNALTNASGGSASNAIANLDGKGTNTTLRGWTLSEAAVTNTGTLRQGGAANFSNSVTIAASLFGADATLTGDIDALGGTFAGSVVADGGANVATFLKIPNGAAPLTDAAGELALDTTITDHKPLLQYYSGAAEMLVPAVLRADLTTTDGEALVYDAAADKFKFGPVAKTNDLLGSSEFIVDGSHRLASDTGPIFRHITNIQGRILNNSEVLVYGRYTNSVLTNLPAQLRASVMLTNLTNVVIRGVGWPTLSSTNYGCFIAVNQCDNLLITGLDIDNNKPLNTTYPADAQVGAVVIWGTNNNVRVKGNRFQNLLHHGVGGGALGLNAICYDEHTAVEDNIFFNCNTTNHVNLGVDGGCIVNLGRGARIIGNRGTNIVRGVELQGSAATGTRLENQLVEKNHFEHFFALNNNYGIFTHFPVANIDPTNTSQITIQGNSVFRGAGQANFIGIYIPFVESITVGPGNILRGGYRGIAIEAGPYNVTKFDVFGNILTAYPQDPAGSVPIAATDTGGSGSLLQGSIRGNIINDASGDGIQTCGNLIEVKDNIINNAAQLAGTGGIRIVNVGDGTITSNTIAGNQIIGGATASGHGILDQSGVATILDGNTIRGYAVPINSSGTIGRSTEYVNRDMHGASVLSVSNAVQAGKLMVTNETTHFGVVTNYGATRGTNVYNGGWQEIVGEQTNRGALHIQPDASVTNALIGLSNTGRTFKAYWLGPFNLTNDIYTIWPTSAPPANVTNLAVVSVTAGGTGVTNEWGYVAGGSGSGGSGTNFSSITVTNTVQELWQTNILSGAGTTNLVVDARQSAKQMCIVSNNFSVCFTNPVSGASGTVRVKQDGTGIRTGIVNYSTAHGGAFTNTYFGTDITGTTFSTNAGYSDYIRWVCEGTNFSIVGFVRGYNLP